MHELSPGQSSTSLKGLLCLLTRVQPSEEQGGAQGSKQTGPLFLEMSPLNPSRNGTLQK